jgi:hypothetical protein
MRTLNKSVCVKQWQVLGMLALSGFAIGNILARLTTALGL